MNLEPLMSSNKQDWETPAGLTDWAISELNLDIPAYDLDVCASADNKKAHFYFDKSDDGLTKNWWGHCWCNPPYINAKEWANKAVDEVRREGGPESVTMLVPARTDTKMWHHVIFPCAAQILFLQGRLTFVGAPAGAPFPSALLLFNRRVGGFMDKPRAHIRAANPPFRGK